LAVILKEPRLFDSVSSGTDPVESTNTWRLVTPPSAVQLNDALVEPENLMSVREV